MRLSSYLRTDLIKKDLKSSTKAGAIEELIDMLCPLRSDIARDRLLNVLLERERLGSTGIGDGLAIPHALLEGMGDPVIIVGRSRAGVPFESLDGMPVHLFMLIIADSASIDGYLKLLARTSRLLKDYSLRKRLMDAADEAALMGILVERDNRL
ncbi:MAG: PTS sugar transporter subunit IIA [Geobacteraceae bacterium]|nr:PTS sugar transporter subunit IIA [Geobacteraceae bacterium]